MARMNVAPTKMSIYNDHGKASKDILPHTNKEIMALLEYHV